jgi:hypothetical protein
MKKILFYFLAVSSLAVQAETDYTPLTSQISFTEVIAAILTAAGALAGVYVVFKGAKLIISSIRGV